MKGYEARHEGSNNGSVGRGTSYGVALQGDSGLPQLSQCGFRGPDHNNGDAGINGPGLPGNVAAVCFRHFALDYQRIVAGRTSQVDGDLVAQSAGHGAAHGFQNPGNLFYDRLLPAQDENAVIFGH